MDPSIRSFWFKINVKRDAINLRYISISGCRMLCKMIRNLFGKSEFCDIDKGVGLFSKKIRVAEIRERLVCKFITLLKTI